MRRFGTATLLRWTAVCAVYLGLSTMIGYAPAAVLCASVVALTWAVISKLSGWWLRGVRVAVGFVASLAIWFSGVVAIWSMERCDRCRSELYTIDYQIIGTTVASDKTSVPSWRALAADGLGVVCKHQLQLIPCDTYGRSYGPPSDYGALLRISSRVFDPERPWHFYYDVSRKWYEWISLSTDDYSPELASRLRRLSIDSPEIADQFWNRAESDRDYPWDGLLVDQLALTAAENGKLLDAIAWLEGSSPEEKRYLDGDPAENCLADVEKLRQLEVGDVLVYRIQNGLDDENGKRWVSGQSVIRLPNESIARSQSLRKLEEVYEMHRGESISIIDYGQRYIDGWFYLNAMLSL
jgi:hypothetical protein